MKPEGLDTAWHLQRQPEAEGTLPEAVRRRGPEPEPALTRTHPQALADHGHDSDHQGRWQPDGSRVHHDSFQSLESCSSCHWQRGPSCQRQPEQMPLPSPAKSAVGGEMLQALLVSCPDLEKVRVLSWSVAVTRQWSQPECCRSLARSGRQLESLKHHGPCQWAPTLASESNLRGASRCRCREGGGTRPPPTRSGWQVTPLAVPNYDHLASGPLTPSPHRVQPQPEAVWRGQAPRRQPE